MIVAELPTTKPNQNCDIGTPPHKELTPIAVKNLGRILPAAPPAAPLADARNVLIQAPPAGTPPSLVVPDAYHDVTYHPQNPQILRPTSACFCGNQKQCCWTRVLSFPSQQPLVKRMSDFWMGFTGGASAFALLAMLSYWVFRVVIPFFIDLIIDRFER